MIFTDKIPWILSLFFGIVAYTANIWLNSISDHPPIAYSFTEIKKSKIEETTIREIRMELENISHDKGFRDFYVDLKFPDDSIFTQFILSDPVLIPVAPAPLLEIKAPEVSGGQIIRFNFPRLGPNIKYETEFKITQNNDANDFPNVYLDINNDAYIVEKDLHIYFLKHKSWFFFFLLLFWIILTSTYLFMYHKYNNSK